LVVFFSFAVGLATELATEMFAFDARAEALEIEVRRDGGAKATPAAGEGLMG
jgi:hypothetical protein